MGNALSRALRLRRIPFAGLLIAGLGITSQARAEGTTILMADRDDDDANGIADMAQPHVLLAPELYPLARGRSRLRVVSLPTNMRLLVDGRAVAGGEAISSGARRVELQGLTAGRGAVALSDKTIQVGVIEVRAMDGQGRDIDFAQSHASLQRTPPDRLPDDPFGSSSDPDALRFVLAGVAEDLPGTVSVLSLGSNGAPLDVIPDMPLAHVVCPKGLPATVVCGSTHPIRAVSDEIDRNHPLVADRSVKAELGGALVVATPRGATQMIRVGGPRRSDLGSIVRYRARLRVVMIRAAARGAPPMGSDTAGAIAIAQAEVRRANALWGSCGVSFGPPSALDVSIVDPPRPHLLALGCDHGLPANGGSIHVRVDGKDVTAKLTRGMLPAAAARVVAAAMRAAGITATVSDNAVIGAGAYGSSDVLVRRRDGSLGAIEVPAAGVVSTDATMTACIGAVNLEDGLQHFGDVDAIAGTVEERALLKAFDDGDPSTIEVLMVPSFGGGGRIGESFISADGGAVRNAVIEDRAGVRADRASFALAHEIGHVLLDDPGHPDDFGVDTPTRLMDADAANGSAHGPRRLLVEECVRAIRQSGPTAPAPLLTLWPFSPLAEGEAPRTRAASRGHVATGH